MNKGSSIFILWGLLLCRSMTFKDLADKVDQMLYEIKRGSKKAIGYMECFYNFI